jgi:tripartite-type tricarboxylate transporter receptor subunit TctC
MKSKFSTAAITPSAIVAALRAGFQESISDPELTESAGKLDLEIDPMNGDELHALVERLHKFLPNVIERPQAITNTEM